MIPGDVMEAIVREGGCPFCDRVPPADGHICHDDDCSVPEVIEALGAEGVPCSLG